MNCVDQHRINAARKLDDIGRLISPANSLSSAVARMFEAIGWTISKDDEQIDSSDIVAFCGMVAALMDPKCVYRKETSFGDEGMGSVLICDECGMVLKYASRPADFLYCPRCGHRLVNVRE